ncbi:hypothetical protein PIB30_056421 [Stylosanthes scabra]|uniref:GRF-type domain-containing protein n=1 Tax=Stylosanthes scabra TaxID=79078 RepID=A0ABU6QK29_9FABA|nr:hypothetical protein [Stylosanthes scabra]
MEEITMEDKESASFGDHRRSASCGSQRSNTGGEIKRRMRKFVAPRCRCGAYAILFQSSTSDNPNRLFFGCLNFKTSTPQCRYFAWLDEYVSSFAVNEAANRDEVLQDMVKLKEKIVALERMVAESNLGFKGGAPKKCWGSAFFLLAWIVCTLCLVALLMV